MSTFRGGVAPWFSRRMVNVAACPCTRLSVAGSTTSAKGAPAMNVVRLTSLFEGSGSLSAVICAGAMLAEPEGAPARTIAAIDADVPADIAVAVQVRTFVPWQLSDAGAVNESSVENGGGVNVNTTRAASAGPLFVTVSAYTAIAPLSTTAGTCPLTARSALVTGTTAITVALALLLAGFGSKSLVVTVKVVRNVAAAVALKERLYVTDEPGVIVTMHVTVVPAAAHGVVTLSGCSEGEYLPVTTASTGSGPDEVTVT